MTGRRLSELDGLRGLAAMWVVLFHLTTGVPHWLEGNAGLAADYTPFTFNIEGWMAVHLFFIISGFVISLTIERSQTPLDFVVSRFARLYPAYWPAVIIAVGVGLAWPSTFLPVTLGQGVVNLTMFQAYLGVPDVNPAFWSLALELGFYALMFLALCTRQQRRLELLGLVWILAQYASLQVLPRFGLVVPWRVSALFGSEFAPLFYAGLLFYRIWSDRLTALRAAGIVLCLLMMLSVLLPHLGVIECVNFGLFAWAISGRAGVMSSPPLLFLGAISYSIYVIHSALGFRVQTALHAVGLPPWPNLLVTLAVLIAASAALTYTVERPGGAAIRRAYAGWKKRRAIAPMATGD